MGDSIYFQRYKRLHNVPGRPVISNSGYYKENVKKGEKVKMVKKVKKVKKVPVKMWWSFDRRNVYDVIFV